ncbi:MAG: hypothetical protein K9L17_12410 [Clostridiales bacterium]|nr:hypothetical protein [Clostridiales bacterium]MCF8023485.1 hypothetical protein [Clostridiales bacterium]
MPAISKIRLTNVQFEQGNKRYNDEIFIFDGHNTAFLLENGGGKTVFIQTVLQAVIPNGVLAGRKIRDTLDVTASPAHIAVEWILNEDPRHYALTAITFYMGKEGLEYFMYANDYTDSTPGEGDPGRIEDLPLARSSGNSTRPAGREEIKEYYRQMASESMNARFFNTRREYQAYLEEQFQILPAEWEAISKINSTEGGVENFFDNCKTTVQLADNLLIPVVEQGMAGEGTKHFARTFDNLRRQFREYLDLGEQIKEYRELNKQVNRVIEQYSYLDTCEQNYLRQRARAKGLRQRIEKEQQDSAARSLELKTKDAEVQNRALQHRQKEFSLEIAKMQGELEEKAARASKLEEEKNKEQQTYNDYHCRVVSLQHAQIQKKLQEKQERLEDTGTQLEELDRSPDIIKLKDELNTCLAGIRYHYDCMEKELHRQKEAEIKTRESHRENLKQTGEQKSQKEKELKNLEVENGKTETEIDGIKKQMQEIAGEILDNPAREDILQKMQDWEDRGYQIQQKLHQVFQQQSQYKTQLDDAEAALAENHNTLNEAIDNKSQAETRLSEIDTRARALLDRLHSLSPRDKEFNSIYRRQAGISHRLEEETEHCRREREKLLEEERVQLRFYDLYKDNRVFTADPELEKWINRNQSEFPGLQAGSSFLELYRREHPQVSLEELYRLFPFWPAAVITGENAETARARLEKQAEKWTHPVFVLTRQEARALVENGEPYPARLVGPSRWPRVTEEENFRQWLQEQQKTAEETAKKRRELDNLWNRWQSLAGEINQFWQKYDYSEVYRPLQEQLEKAERKQQQANEEISRLNSRIEEIRKQQEELQKRKTVLEDEQSDISRRQRRAQKWKTLNEYKQRLESRLDRDKKREAPLQQKIDRLQSETGRLQEAINHQQEKINAVDNQVSVLQAGEDYKRVRDTDPLPAGNSLETLQFRARALERKLRGIQEDREQLENRQQELEKEITALKKDKQRHLKWYSSIIDQELQFPPNGEDEINRLGELRQKTEKKLEDIKGKFETAQNEKIDREARLQQQQEHYTREFGQDTPVFDFTGRDLNQVREDLEKEKENLEQEKNVLQRKQNEEYRLARELDNVQTELEASDRVYSFNHPDLEAIPLTSGDEQEYPYRRKKFTENMLKELEKEKSEREEHLQLVNKVIKEFEEFCTGQLKDEKTRQQSLNGIRLKTNYREIKEWGEHLQERITAAVNIKETEMRTRDQEVQNFITHLHSHLVRICEELQTIPRMTAVRVGERKKQVYDFTVPAWDEHHGKARLREHIEWMQKKLEEDKFHTEKGLEDTAKIRKQIEDWLHPKQLLQVIDPNQEIKVRCRKVNSENHVSSAFTNWPRTEKWSGGERWSKNMSLFLGILNYLAEKQGHHLHREKGNHRVVLLDNPFGKASSDHVLAPVFFIARQLGFQLLALTAHAGGKFLKDHFPIIYSLRLRRTADPSISVMDKEKEIHRAYFQDLDPTVIERLGED